jgi:hypothetical protein
VATQIAEQISYEGGADTPHGGYLRAEYNDNTMRLVAAIGRNGLLRWGPVGTHPDTWPPENSLAFGPAEQRVAIPGNVQLSNVRTGSVQGFNWSFAYLDPR